MYNVISQVYCIKPEGRIQQITNILMLKKEGHLNSPAFLKISIGMNIIMITNLLYVNILYGDRFLY